MKVTLMDVQQPRKLLDLIDTCEGSVFCCGMDLRNNRNVGDLLCGMTASGQSLPRLELELTESEDLAKLLHYAQMGGKYRLTIDYGRTAA